MKRCDYETGHHERRSGTVEPVTCGRPATHTGKSDYYGRRYLCAKHRQAVAVADALDAMDGLEGMGLRDIIEGRE